MIGRGESRCRGWVIDYGRGVLVQEMGDRLWQGGPDAGDG